MTKMTKEGTILAIILSLCGLCQVGGLLWLSSLIHWACPVMGFGIMVIVGVFIYNIAAND